MYVRDEKEQLLFSRWVVSNSLKAISERIVACESFPH